MPKYIVIDGLDGSGKGGLIQSIRKSPAGQKFAYLKEPGGTNLAKRLGEIVFFETVDPCTAMLLFLASRRETRNVVQLYLEQGTHVISDRSDSSTFAFQIRGRERKDLEESFWLTSKLMAPYPSLYIFLDLPAEVAQERIKQRGEMGGEVSKFDSEALDFHNRVRKGFHEFSELCGRPCRFVDASRSREEVAEEVLRIISEHIEE